MSNPASLLSAARDPGMLAGLLPSFADIGNAIAAQPVLAAAGLLGVAAIMRAAWVLTREPIRPAAATMAAHDATQAAPVVVYWQGLRPQAHASSAAISELAPATPHEVRSVARTAGAFSLFPLPDLDGGEPTRPSTFRA